MPNPTRAEAIKKLLDARTQLDLAALYHPGMECQVNVARDEGVKKDGFTGKAKQTFTDGINTWFTFRIPKNSWAEPEDNSAIEMTYPLFDYAEGIGMTGWDFRALRSMWVAFDFDAIVGHSEKHAKRLTDEELAVVKEKACGIPWVTVRRSASGNALHLYVFFAEPVPTKNHTEHAALGRAVLAEMSALAGFDFQGKVDACGGNMWVWHRKMPKGPSGTQRDGRGLELLKAAEHAMLDAPKGWQRYTKVVKGERKKSLPEFAEGREANFDETVGQHPHVPLDVDHKEHVDWLLKNQGWGWWDSDHHMLVTHTHHLKRLFEAFKDGGRPMKGSFQTSSPATQVDEQNCFCFPMRAGSWSVRRYSPGAAEHPSWEQDGKGWTRCYFNRDPDLRTAARAKGGVETDKGAFQFPVLEDVGEVVKLIGGEVKIPNVAAHRPGRLMPHKDGRRVVVAVDQQPGDEKHMVGWYSEKGKEWRIVVNANARLEADNEVGTFDEMIRHATNETRVDAGWFVKVGDHWNHEPKSHVSIAMSSLGKKKAEIDALMGASVLKPWVIVARPFEDEYPGDRAWNRSKVRLRYPRSEEVGPFPTWRKVFEHIGKGLNDALANSGWAQANDVRHGADYLELFYASMLQDPYARRPYLFLYSEEQDTGKSIFHEAARLIITDEGIVEGNKVIEGKDSFNGQMEGAVLVYLEELDLQRNKGAYERIKHWVTSPFISIRKLYIDAYQMPNCVTFVHCANSAKSVPVFPGDSRVTMIYVNPLGPKEMIPKPELLEMLKKEAPHFMNHLLQLDIPPSGSRLALPVINTSEKDSISSNTMDALEAFIDQTCFYVPGEMLKFSEFFEKFKESLDPHDLADWGSRNKVSAALPPRLPVGKRGPETFIGNLSWAPRPEGAPEKPRLVLHKRQLVPASSLAGAVVQAQAAALQMSVSVHPDATPAQVTADSATCGAACGHFKCARAPLHDPPHSSAEGVEW